MSGVLEQRERPIVASARVRTAAPPSPCDDDMTCRTPARGAMRRRVRAAATGRRGCEGITPAEQASGGCIPRLWMERVGGRRMLGDDRGTVAASVPARSAGGEGPVL